MQDDDKRKDDDKKKDSLCELVPLHAGLCPSSQLDSASYFLSCEARRQCHANVLTMQDDDKRKDDDKKKDSLCELVPLHAGLCPSSQLDSESCLVLVLRSPSTISTECSHHAGR